MLLVQRAKRLRKETGDDRYHAPMEITKKNMREQVENVLGRPFKMVVQEPMLAAITAYMSVCRGLFYPMKLPTAYASPSVRLRLLVPQLRRVPDSVFPGTSFQRGYFWSHVSPDHGWWNHRCNYCAYLSPAPSLHRGVPVTDPWA